MKKQIVFLCYGILGIARVPTRAPPLLITSHNRFAFSLNEKTGRLLQRTGGLTRQSGRLC